jgi:DNA polymerase epsilon subunit 1
MEMAAMVTHIGSAIISTAKDLVDKVGLPLELDTDGIWCMLPAGFPEDFFLKDIYGKRVKFSYPCFMLNELVYDRYKNDQY